MNTNYSNMRHNPWNSSLSFLNGTSPKLLPPSGELQQRREVQRIVEISYCVLLALLSLLGNTSLLAIFVKKRHMRTTANCFIFNMAISDLAYVVFVLPVVLQQVISRSTEWRLGGVLGSITCKFTSFIRDVSFTVSIMSMVAMALDRFYAVVYPMRRKPKCLKPKCAISIIWFVATASFAIHFYVFRLVVHPIHKTVFCVTVWSPVFDQAKSPKRYYLFAVMLLFVTPLIIMTVIYGIIIRKLKHQNIPGVRTSEMEKLRRKRNRNITKVGVLIVLCFFFSWAPYHCFLLLKHFLWKEKPPLHLKKLIELMYSIALNLSITSIASNACVCYACSSRFRSCLRQMLSNCSCSSKQRQRVQILTLNNCSNGAQPTTHNLQDTEATKGTTNNGISTGQTTENLEIEFDTKL